MTLAIDGATDTTNSQTNTQSITLTTAAANEVICLFSYVETAYMTQPVTVSSVSASGLTFTKRSGDSSTAMGNIEFWYAIAGTALSSVTITATYNINYDDGCLIAFGVSGANTAAPFDTNASLPQAAPSSSSSGSYTATATASTTNATSLLLFVVGGDDTSNGYNQVPSGWTDARDSFNGGGNDYSSLCVATKLVSAAQSSATYTWGATQLNGVGVCGEYIFDAIVPAGSGGGGGSVDASSISATTKKPNAALSGSSTIPGETGTITARSKKPTTSIAATSAVPNETGAVLAIARKPTASISGTTAVSSETGTITARTKKPTSFLSGASSVPNETGLISARTKKPSASISGISAAPNETGSITAATKKPTTVWTGASALPGESGTVTATTKKPSASISGNSVLPNEAGTIAATTKKPSTSLSGSIGETGSINASFRRVSAVLNGTLTDYGSVAASTKKPTASVVGTSSAGYVDTGTLTATTKKPSSSFAGTLNESGIINPSFRRLSATLNGTVNESRSIAGSTRKTTASLAGTATSVTDTGTITATTKKAITALYGPMAAVARGGPSDGADDPDIARAVLLNRRRRKRIDAKRRLQAPKQTIEGAEEPIELTSASTPPTLSQGQFDNIVTSMQAIIGHREMMQDEDDVAALLAWAY